MIKKPFFCFILALAGIYPYTLAFSGLFERTPSCEKSAKKLLGSGYLYRSDLILVSDDAHHLAAFVVFYKSKKVKGNFYERVNLTMKLFRYQREGDDYALMSEQGTCEKMFDFEHHRAVMDKDRTIYFYYRRGKSFSVWPEDNQLEIRSHSVPVEGFSPSSISIDKASGLIYATHKKHIVRQPAPGNYVFEEWLRFDDLVAPTKQWNPFRLRVSDEQLWVSMVISDNEDIYAPAVYEYWVFDMKKALIKKQASRAAYTRFHPGSPATGLSLDMIKKQKYRPDVRPEPPDMALKYIDSSTGEETGIVRIPGAKSDLALSGTNFSGNGTLFSVYNLYDDEAQAVLHLVTYHPSAGKSETLLPLLRLP